MVQSIYTRPRIGDAHSQCAKAKGDSAPGAMLATENRIWAICTDFAGRTLRKCPRAFSIASMVLNMADY